MGAPLSQSLMSLAYNQIAATNGSPYVKYEGFIKAGGIIYNPLKITRVTETMDCVNDYADEKHVYMVIPDGDLVRYIAPYQDDLNITLTIHLTNSAGSVASSMPPITKTYRAYLADQVKSPVEMGNVRGISSNQMENMSGLKIVCFRIEELIVEQMRLLRIGTGIRGSKPIDIAVSLLKSTTDMAQLEDDAKIQRWTVDGQSNPLVRNSMVFPDNTPLVNVPDLVQKTAGIYAEGLGFYIRGGGVHLWRLYGLDRMETSVSRLRVYLSPDPQAGVSERSWRIPPDDPNLLEIWIAHPISVKDDTLSLIQQVGTGIQNVDPSKILGDFATVRDNRLSVSQSTNEMAFKNTTLITGRNVINATDPTSNPYKLSSRLSVSKGVLLTVAWAHSLSDLIVPGMAVEVVYDFEGIIHTTEGTLLSSFSVSDSLGAGITSYVSAMVTTLSLFVDRETFFYKDWVENDDAIDHTTLPEYKAVF